MRRQFVLWVVALVLLSPMAVVGRAWADRIHVEFSIEGTFSKGDSTLAVIRDDGAKVKVGDAWIKFEPATLPPNIMAPVDGLLLGKFTWGDRLSLFDTDTFGGVDFNLKITQSDPTEGTNTVVADLTGSIERWLLIPDNDVRISFGGQSVRIPDSTMANLPVITYTPKDVSFGNFTFCDPYPSAELRMDIDYTPPTVPLPPSAWGGLAMLGVFGGWRLLRGRVA